MFEIRILLPAEQVVPFGNSIGQTCVGFPQLMAGGLAEVQALLAEDMPDLERVRQVVAFMAASANATMSVGEQVAQLIGRSEPVRIDGGTIQ